MGISLAGGTALRGAARAAARMPGKKLGQEGPVCLRSGQVLRLREDQRGTLLTLRGTVWVTRDGDIRDVILESGETMILDGAAGVLVSAMSDASIALR